jgi:large subunit ribosomal protein L3
MGKRKHHAPRRGSMAFYPRGRAKALRPRVRAWPRSGEPRLLGFPGYKVGMAHMVMIDDRPATPNFGKPLYSPVTLLATPAVHICAVKAYAQTAYGRKTLTEVWAKELPKGIERKVRINAEKASANLEGMKRLEERIHQTSVLVATIPKEVKLEQKKPYLFEVGVGGDPREALKYALSILGKKVSVHEVLKPGLYVDTIAVTKGKGTQGPVKRFGIKRKPHKARKSVRAVGSLGPIAPGNVMFTVPRAGQMGFHQRTEHNKRVLMVANTKDRDLTPPGGFNRFGRLSGDYVVVRGSVPGPQKRLVILRPAIRPTPQKVQEPKILELVVPRS